MSPEAHGLILPVGQSFLAPSQYASAATPPETRRATLAFGTGASGRTTGYEDVCARMGFSLAVTPTRVRFIIRNSDVLFSATTAIALSFTGIWWGTPNVGAESAWLGDFTAVPTQLSSSFTVDPTATGAQYTSPWFTPPASAKANAFQGVSFGFTVASDSMVNTDGTPGWCWHSATNTGQASSAGNAGVPTGGTASPYNVPLDIRMEYEFVGRNQIGLYLGTSLTIGWLDQAAPAATGHMGPNNSWPQIAANRLGHVAINGGVTGGGANSFTNTGQLAWTRFDLGPDINSGVSCIPDYAVIDLGINDSFNLTPLANFQANIQTVIANLQAAGINKIFITTAAPAGGAGNLGGWQAQAAVLRTALTAGALGSVVLQGPITSATPQVGPGFPNPGVAGSWYNAGNVYTVALCILNSTTMVTVASGGFPSVQVGMMVSGTDIPAGTFVTAISGNTMTLSQAATGTTTATLTFSPFGIYLDLPSSGIGEGPFMVTAITGASNLTLTVAGTTVNAHDTNSAVFTLAEGRRQLYNNWIRGGVPGTIATLEFAALAQQSGSPVPSAIGVPIVPLASMNPEHYRFQCELHPSNPGLYHRWAATFAGGLAGV